MARNSVAQRGHIVHGRMSPSFIGGPFAVFYIDGRRKVGASVTGIQTAEACEAHAVEYSRSYGVPIVSPRLTPAGVYTD